MGEAGGRGARGSALTDFLLLYGALYAAYGTQSAYLPAFLQNHGLAAERIGLVVALGTLVRIVSGPAVGRLADHGRRSLVLAVFAALSGVVGGFYLIAFGLAPLLAVTLAEAAVSAALPPLSDALAVAAAPGAGFQYGWVRGAGSAAFVVGTLLSGQLIDRVGLAAIMVVSNVLLIAAAACAARLPAPATEPGPSPPIFGAFRSLAAVPAYRRLILVVVLVLGSHALNDTFAVIVWRAAGYGGTAVSVLWSCAVASEVLVFLLAGPWLLARLGAAKCAGLSAAAGALRWGAMGATTSVFALAAAQALHGLTFALLHMAAMQVIATTTPKRLAATAQAVYGSLALGLASATLTFASGYLYAGLGMRAYWPMAALCALALPFVGGLASREETSAPQS